MTDRVRALLGVAVVAAVFAVPIPGAFVDVGGAMEEGFMLVFPERVLAGDVPNRDFLHLYGPGSLWVLAAAYSAFGVDIAVERVVGALQLLGVVLAVRSWVRPWGEAMATVAAVVAVVFAITPIGLIALAWMGALALLLWGVFLVLRAAEGASRNLAVGGGALVGFALLYRPDVAAAAALSALALAPVLRRDRLWRPALAGTVAGSAPMLVHLALAGVGNAIAGMVIDPVFRLRSGRHLPVPPSADVLDGFLQRVNELEVIDWPHPFTVAVQLRTWFFVIVAATVVLVAAAIHGRRAQAPHGLRLRVLAAIGVGILPQAIQRPDSTHLAWVGCFTLAVLPVALAELLPSRAAWRLRAASGVAVVVGLVAFAFPAFTLRPYTELALQSVGRERNAIAVRHGGRTFFVGREDVASAVEELAEVVERETDPGDRLFVGPADLTRTPFVDSWLYHLFPDLVPATYFIEMDPGIANAPGSRLASDLASADVVLLTDTWDAWDEPNTSTEAGDPAASRVLDDGFCQVEERAGISLWKRCR